MYAGPAAAIITSHGGVGGGNSIVVNSNSSSITLVVYFLGIVFFASILELEYSVASGVLADKTYEAHHERSLTQYEAATFCRERGGQLATIVDHDEQQHVVTELRSSVNNYWIGLTFDFMPRLTWLDGTEYSGTFATTITCLNSTKTFEHF